MSQRWFRPRVWGLGLFRCEFLPYSTMPQDYEGIVFPNYSGLYAGYGGGSHHAGRFLKVVVKKGQQPLKNGLLLNIFKYDKGTVMGTCKMRKIQLFKND